MQRFKIVWIVKGVLLGLAIFIVGEILYTGILVGIAMCWLAHKEGGIGIAGGNWDVRGLGHSPGLWGALLFAIVIGLWIVRSKTM